MWKFPVVENSVSAVLTISKLPTFWLNVNNFMCVINPVGIMRVLTHDKASKPIFQVEEL